MVRTWDDEETNSLVYNMARMKLPKAHVRVCLSLKQWCRKPPNLKYNFSSQDCLEGLYPVGSADTLGFYHDGPQTSPKPSSRKQSFARTLDLAQLGVLANLGLPMDRVLRRFQDGDALCAECWVPGYMCRHRGLLPTRLRHRWRNCFWHFVMLRICAPQLILLLVLLYALVTECFQNVPSLSF